MRYLGLQIWLCSSDGPRKDAIDALQNQIEFYTREILRLRSSQNSHVPIAGMPAELLSEVFCHIVESGVEIKNLSFGIQATPQDCDARFGIGTFGFRQVCKHWNKVAIGSPQLWVWWVAGATKAWPLFYERSKGSPISLIWRYPRSSTVRSGVLKDAALLGRIHRLDFGGEYTHFKRLFSALDSTSLFNASSVRLEIAPYNRENSEERLVRFFSLSFPKLSKLDVKGFLPDPLSPAFASSILTSLKLSSSARDKPRYTLAQFSRILHNLPNLQKLDLEDNAIPRIVASEVPVPYALSRLADLTLRGMMGCISGFMNLVDMSSPPHNIILGFRNHYDTAVPALVDTVKGILAAYYQRTGLTYPRNAANFMVKYKHWKESGVPLIFDIKSAKSRSAPPSTPQFTLRLEFLDLYEFHQLLPLFPLKTVQSFTADGLFFSRREYRSILWKMNHLLHLHLAALDIKPVLEAMNYNSPGAS